MDRKRSTYLFSQSHSVSMKNLEKKVVSTISNIDPSGKEYTFKILHA